MTKAIFSNQVRNKRLTLGLTQTQLAEQAGISRSAVTAIEGNNLIPSVAAALAIAKVLGTNVEHLFGQELTSNESEVWALQPVASSTACWQADINGRTVLIPVLSSPNCCFPPDRILGSTQIVNTKCRADETLVVACCDPAVGVLASHFHATTGLRMLFLPCSSSQAIDMLRAGLVHMAGIHYSTNEHPERNAQYIKSQLGTGFEVVRVARWNEGIAVRSESRFRSVRATTNAKLTWIGREVGSGARQCLDRLLKGRTVPRFIASNHRGVAESIKSGYADAGVCLQLTCLEAGLDFIPVQEEEYDLCFPREIASDRRIQGLLSTLRTKSYRDFLSQLPGYDGAETGNLYSVN
jgi:putative molybdopterin biosynthesis protein